MIDDLEHADVVWQNRCDRRKRNQALPQRIASYQKSRTLRSSRHCRNPLRAPKTMRSLTRRRRVPGRSHWQSVDRTCITDHLSLTVYRRPKSVIAPRTRSTYPLMHISTVWVPRPRIAAERGMHPQDPKHCRSH